MPEWKTCEIGDTTKGGKVEKRRVGAGGGAIGHSRYRGYLYGPVRNGADEDVAEEDRLGLYAGSGVQLTEYDEMYDWTETWKLPEIKGSVGMTFTCQEMFSKRETLRVAGGEQVKGNCKAKSEP